MKILVADDSDFLREAVRRLLEPEGYEVVEAADGVEAVTKIFEHSPALVLLDVTMPRLTGYVACRLIKEDPLLAAIPVLILTSRDSAEDRYWAERSGADGFLTKDALGAGLVSAINAALASHALLQLNGLEELPPALGEVDVLYRVCEMLDRKLFEATIVTELLSLTNGHGAEESLQVVFEHLSRVVAIDVGAIAFAKSRRLHLSSPVDILPSDLTEIVSFATRQLSAVEATKRTDALEVSWLGPPRELDHDQTGWGSWYAAPLRYRGERVGLLVLSARAHGVFDPHTMRTLRTLEPIIAGVVANSAEAENLALVAEAPLESEPTGHRSFRLTHM